jgi:predicted nucleic acid-binding Zn ribbon protein
MAMRREGYGWHMYEMKRKKICAMIFFGLMALIFAMIAGMLHLKLHMEE